MKKQLSICLIVVLAILFVLLWLSKRPPLAEKSPTSLAITNQIRTGSIIEPTNAILPNNNETNSSTELAAAIRAEKANEGSIMSAAINAKLNEENKQSQDFYGKVVDEHGNSIIDVNVTGQLVLEPNYNNAEKVYVYKVKSDIAGLFQFTDIQGSSFNVQAKKDGYRWGERGEGFSWPTGKSSPENRVVLTLWKIRGAEPLADSSINAQIPYDGSPVRFEIATGKESPNGNLQVTLSRSPQEVRRGKDKFDWAIRVELLNGGLIEENDPYPYWAPEVGYQPSFKFNISSNNVPWRSSFENKFYIKNSLGQYGLMQFGVYSALTPARLQINFTINPSGSQNLEPDFSK